MNYDENFYETNKFSIIEPCKVDKKKNSGFFVFFLKVIIGFFFLSFGFLYQNIQIPLFELFLFMGESQDLRCPHCDSIDRIH